MSSKSNPTVIGLFVLGALALVVVGVLILGTGKLFRETLTYVAYFQESVQGLDVGSAVKVKGVNIGRVKDVRAVYIPQSDQVLTRVFVEIDPRASGDPKRMEAVPSLEEIQELIYGLIIHKGLRAQLDLESLVTGRLFIQLDFHPKTAITLVDAEGEYPELPTIPSKTEQLLQAVNEAGAKFSALPLEELVLATHSTIEAIQGIVKTPEVMEIIRNLERTTRQIESLMQNIDSKVEPVASSVTSTMSETTKLVQTIEAKVGPVSSNINATFLEASTTLTEAQETLASIRRTIGEESTLHYQLTKTLDQLGSAARSIRVMADYLERNPNAIIYGKKGFGR